MTSWAARVWVVAVMLLASLWAAPAVASDAVRVVAIEQGGSTSVGTGFLLRLGDGEVVLVTAYHVVKGAEEIKVSFSEQNTFDLVELERSRLCLLTHLGTAVFTLAPGTLQSLEGHGAKVLAPRETSNVPAGAYLRVIGNPTIRLFKKKIGLLNSAAGVTYATRQKAVDLLGEGRVLPPAHGTMLLLLEGLGVHFGFSGGPVLSGNTVVGILMGGASSETLHTRSWAVELAPVVKALRENQCKKQSGWPSDGFVQNVYATPEEPLLEILEVTPNHHTVTKCEGDQVIELDAERTTMVKVKMRVRSSPGQLILKSSLDDDGFVTPMSDPVELGESWQIRELEVPIRPKGVGRLPTGPLRLQLTLMTDSPGSKLERLPPITLCAQVRRSARIELGPSVYGRIMPEELGAPVPMAAGLRLGGSIERSSSARSYALVGFLDARAEIGREPRRFLAPGADGVELEREILRAYSVGGDLLLGLRWHPSQSLVITGAVGPTLLPVLIEGERTFRLRGGGGLVVMIAWFKPRMSAGLSLRLGLENDPVSDRRYALSPTTVTTAVEPTLRYVVGLGLDFDGAFVLR